MSLADILILVAVGILFVLAVRYVIRHPSSCGGNCADCARRCKK